MIIQIYEVMNPSEAAVLADLGVDHIGTVILSRDDWKNSVLKETIDASRKGSSKSVLIPLFNEPDNVFRTLDFYRPHIVHFCEILAGQDASEIEAMLSLQAMIRKRFPEVKIMRSIPIAEAGYADKIDTICLAKTFESASDCFLTDTLLLKDGIAHGDHQPVGNFVGITGRVCDWDMAARLVESSGVPVILAGGISPENVFEGIMKVRPAGIDSCTLTNALDDGGRPIRFKKDIQKVVRLIEEVRRAEKEMLTNPNPAIFHVGG